MNMDKLNKQEQKQQYFWLGVAFTLIMFVVLLGLFLIKFNHSHSQKLDCINITFEEQYEFGMKNIVGEYAISHIAYKAGGNFKYYNQSASYKNLTIKGDYTNYYTDERGFIIVKVKNNESAVVNVSGDITWCRNYCSFDGEDCRW